MRILFELVLLPLAVEVIAGLVTECLIRLTDKRDKNKKTIG